MIRQLRCGLLVVAAGCTQSAGRAPTSGVHGPVAAGDRPTDAGGTDGADGSIATAPKPPLTGLIDMQDISWHNTADVGPNFTIDNVNRFPGVFGGIVINATWSAIQPAQDGALQFDSIDTALALVRQYNAENPGAPLGTKLRVYAGTNAPPWAKQLDGGPFSIARNRVGSCADGCPLLTIGKIWSPTYIAAWRQFQQQLAARYDTEPLVRHVTVTSCGQQTDEPFVPTTDAASQSTLTAAGYTDDLQRACLLGVVDDYAAWALTNVDYTINPFTPITGRADDTMFPESVMAACRGAFGARCVLGNHALSAPLRTADHGVYGALAVLADLGGPLSFQTASPTVMSCRWTQTIAQGVALGASSIEIWPHAARQGFVDSLTPDNLQDLAAELVTPIALDPAPTGSCPGFH